MSSPRESPLNCVEIEETRGRFFLTTSESASTVVEEERTRFLVGMKPPLLVDAVELKVESAGLGLGGGTFIREGIWMRGIEDERVRL
jgi:hypothetical protein